MHLLMFVLLVSRILLCESYLSDSIISCAIGTLTQLKTDTEHIYSVSNKNRIKSIESNVDFMFYSREHPDGVKFIFNDEESLQKCSFDPKRPTKIITHGFNGKGNQDSCIGPTKAFLEIGDFNIFVMDWYEHQCGGFWIPLYWKVIKQLKEVGSHLAKMINFLETHGMNTNTTTLIGHSLGAHVVGIAGYNTKSKLGHVVGLDPAEPFLKRKGPGERISDQDAQHVEIIHTNGNHCGMFKQLGHYDFYVNGGVKQPGCKNNHCSHQRAYAYYTESINGVNGFFGKRCTDTNSISNDKCNGDTAEMGGESRNFISPGIYYVETNDCYPFAKGN